MKKYRFVIIGLIVLLDILGYFYLGLRAVLFIIVTVEAPVIIAIMLARDAYERSGCKKVFGERFETRIIRRRGKGGGAFIWCRKTRRILLNRQTGEPWIDMWLLLSGYVSLEPVKDNTSRSYPDTRSAAEHRVFKLTKEKLKVTTRRRIAYARDKFNYRIESIEWGYPPIVGDIFEVEKVDKEAIREEDVQQSDILKWWSIDEIHSSEHVHPFMKDLILYLSSPTYRNSKPDGPEYWSLDEPFERLDLEKEGK